MNHILGGTIGDIHLGNTRNGTKNIIDKLYRYITPDLFRKLDFFVVNGDLFDRDIPLASTDALMIAEFDKYLNDLSKKYNVYLYYLKGTFTHDYDQIKTLTKYNESHLFKYVDKIDVIYNKDLDMYFGFIPDDTGYSPIEIERLLLEKMSSMGIQKLDMLFIHGMFDYQLPIKQEHSFDVNQFNFVKYYIVINHIHKHSVFKNIIAPGSFDRLTFGEEEKKGFVLLTLSKTGDKSFSFIENKYAMLFKTFKLNTVDINHWYKVIEDYIKAYKPDNIRLIRYVNIELDSIIDMIKSYGIRVKTENEIESENELLIEDTYEVHQINRDNIKDELSKIIRITDKHKKLLADIL